ncbi:MAG: DUF3800 domain-containing protein [Planctomycetota bacterium]|nr:DUF3800 domain-containing protein [Planctomycetota bacterium]
MYLLYADESNLDPAAGDFFVYGGIAVPGDHAQALSAEIDQIRERFSIPREFLLKFNPKPDQLEHESFKGLKQAVVEAAVSHGCTMLVSVTLHAIAKTPEVARRYGINTVLLGFDGLMNRFDQPGLVLIDRFDDRQIDRQLRDRFAVGARDLPYSKTMRHKHIVGIHYSAIGQSHFCSIVDIAVSSFRFAVNALSSEDQSRIGSAESLLKILSPLFHRWSTSTKVAEISLTFCPKFIEHELYREKYEALRTSLASFGVEAQQAITDTPSY